MTDHSPQPPSLPLQQPSQQSQQPSPPSQQPLPHSPPKGRVTVTHPRTVAPRRSNHTGARETAPRVVSAGTGGSDLLGTNDLQSLMQSQLRLSLRFVSILAVLLVSGPLVLANIAWFSTHRIAGVPITWLILGFGFFPIFLLVARSYVRATEELEVRFVAHVKSGNDSAT
jgi:hypothetical protein